MVYSLLVSYSGVVTYPMIYKSDLTGVDLVRYSGDIVSYLIVSHSGWVLMLLLPTVQSSQNSRSP